LGLQSINGLIEAEMLRKTATVNHLARVIVDAEQRRAGAARLNGDQRRLPGGRSRTAQQVGQFGDRLRLEKGGQRNLCLKGLLDSREQTRRQQRVAPQFKGLL